MELYEIITLYFLTGFWALYLAGNLFVGGNVWSATGINDDDIVLDIVINIIVLITWPLWAVVLYIHRK